MSKPILPLPFPPAFHFSYFFFSNSKIFLTHPLIDLLVRKIEFKILMLSLKLNNLWLMMLHA